MATDALSIQVLEAIAAKLRDVTKAKGYRTDLGAKVSVEDDYASLVSQPGQTNKPGPTTFVGAADMPADAKNSGNNTKATTMNIVIEFALPVSLAKIHTTAHNGLADMRQRLPSGTALGVDGCTSFIVDGSTILRRPEGFPGVVAQITAHVTLTERTPVARED